MRQTASLRVKLGRANVQKPAPGMHPMEWWAAKDGLSYPRMGAIVRGLIARGAMRVRHYIIRTPQRVMPVPHYGLTAKGKRL